MRLLARTALTLWVLSCLPLASRAAPDYEKWLREEVVWIISEAERKEFESLGDDEERDAFVERFWLRRDPSPATQRNEYKEEHYRRLLFASKAFQEGTPGWKTDRGRIYIIHGPPDDQTFLRSRSAISALVQVPLSERSPNTIVWTYHRNPYARFYKGEIRLVFQPSSGLNRQIFALSDSAAAQQKADQMARKFGPAADSTWLEADVRYRLVMAGPPAVVNGAGAELPASGGTERARYLDDLLRSPGELLEEREREAKRREAAGRELRGAVATRVSYGPLPFRLSIQSYHRPSAEWLLSLEVEVDGSRLGEDRCDLYVALVDSRGELFDEFLDSVAVTRREQAEAVRYVNGFSVPAGQYTLRAVLREVSSRKTGYQELPVVLGEPEPGRIRLGSIMLTGRVEPVPQRAGSRAGNGVIFNNARLLPDPVRRFTRADHLFLYLQLWTPRDQSEVSLNGNFISHGQIVKRLSPRRVPGRPGGFLEYGTVVSLSDFDPGEYTLQVQALDHLTRTFDIERTSFQIVEPAQ